MKTKIYLFTSLFVMGFLLNACKTASYVGQYNQLNETKVILSKKNFKVLGSFKGVAKGKKSLFFLSNGKKIGGLIARAKENLLENAAKAGVELKGSRALVNVTTDIYEEDNKVIVIMSAEIIEFTE